MTKLQNSINNRKYTKIVKQKINTAIEKVYKIEQAVELFINNLEKGYSSSHEIQRRANNLRLHLAGDIT